MYCSFIRDSREVVIVQGLYMLLHCTLGYRDAFVLTEFAFTLAVSVPESTRVINNEVLGTVLRYGVVPVRLRAAAFSGLDLVHRYSTHGSVGLSLASRMRRRWRHSRVVGGMNSVNCGFLRMAAVRSTTP